MSESYQTQLKPDKVFLDADGLPVWVFFIKKNGTEQNFILCVFKQTDKKYIVKIAGIQQEAKSKMELKPNGSPLDLYKNEYYSIEWRSCDKFFYNGKKDIEDLINHMLLLANRGDGIVASFYCYKVPNKDGKL